MTPAPTKTAIVTGASRGIGGNGSTVERGKYVAMLLDNFDPLVLPPGHRAIG